MILGTWVPALNIFETSLRRGKFDDNRVLSDGSLMEFAGVLPMDAVFDSPEDVPEDIKTNKRYAGNEGCVSNSHPLKWCTLPRRTLASRCAFWGSVVRVHDSMRKKQRTSYALAWSLPPPCSLRCTPKACFREALG